MKHNDKNLKKGQTLREVGMFIFGGNEDWLWFKQMNVAGINAEFLTKALRKKTFLNLTTPKLYQLGHLDKPTVFLIYYWRGCPENILFPTTTLAYIHSYDNLLSHISVGQSTAIFLWDEFFQCRSVIAEKHIISIISL